PESPAPHAGCGADGTVVGPGGGRAPPDPPRALGAVERLPARRAVCLAVVELGLCPVAPPGGVDHWGQWLTVQQFMDPMALYQRGWDLCATILSDWGAYMGFGAIMHVGDLYVMGLAFLGILLSHVLMAAEVFLTVIEFTLLTICSTILLPF